MAETSVAYKCLNCGGPLTFQPGKPTVTCEYCDTEFEVATLEKMYAKQEELAAKAQEAKEAKWKTDEAGTEWSVDEAQLMKAFTCSACGAEIVCDENTMATECVYCGNPTMLPHRFEGMLKPDLIIPFKKTKEEAVAALKQFYEGKKLLPDAFTANNRIEAIQGMYVPFWLFDSSAGGRGVYNTTSSLVFDEGDEVVTQTSHFQCVRAGEAEFEMIPVDGSTKMDDQFMESIEPFDYSELVPFTTAYLASYLADKYDVDAETSVPRANARIENSIATELEKTVGPQYNTCITESCDCYENEGKVQYAMVPVWILTTQFEGKPYTFMMNGQTGKFVGSLPIDKSKLHKYQLMAFALAAVLTFAILYFVL